jgi:8-oxo-dGTP pyrophosphatase MutT (NUDIX family)
MNQFLFEYCQKIVVFSADKQSVLLAKRSGESDYDQTFTFIGGKMETSDATILAALKREKNEEIGEQFKIKIAPTYSHNLLFVKQNGTHMVLPHYYALHISGDVALSDEYSDWRWVKVSELNGFEPKIANIPEVVKRLRELEAVLEGHRFEVI